MESPEKTLAALSARIEAVIFDMDGVIVDSEPLHLLAYQELLAPLGIEYSHALNQEFLGRKDIELSGVLIERFGLKLTPAEFVERKEANLLRLLQTQARIRPGVKELLLEAQRLGVPTAVASSATLPTIKFVIDVLDLVPYFANLTSGDEVAHGKPAPDVFLLAARRLGIEPSACLVIEDTSNGIKAAKAAGMWCLSVPCDQTRHEDHSHADCHLDTLEKLRLQDLLSRA